MSNRFIISRVNPIKVVEVNPALIPQYISKHMDDFLLSERLTQWQKGSYAQPFQNNDVQSLQAQNNMGQLQVDIINCQKQVLLTALMTQRQQNQYDPTTFIYESNTAFTPLDEGFYFTKITAGGGIKTYISEPLHIKEQHNNTLLFEYINRSYYQNFLFETGITPSLRVQGLLRLKDTPSKDTLYEDQVLDMVMVQSKPYRVWELILFQIPDWMKDKVNRILGCSGCRIDGKYFNKNGEGAKWEQENITDNGLLSDYSIELRELINRDSDIFSTDENENEELTMMLNVDSKGFADTSEDASSTILTVIDVE